MKNKQKKIIEKQMIQHRKNNRVRILGFILLIAAPCLVCYLFAGVSIVSIGSTLLIFIGMFGFLSLIVWLTSYGEPEVQ